jgi:hypothetical protein
MQVMKTITGKPASSIAIFAEEIRYTRCYFDLMKSNAGLLRPTFLNLKNTLKNLAGPSLTLMIMDWKEQPIADQRFTKLISGYFTPVETTRFISIAVHKYEVKGQKLEALKVLFNIS